jgi:hypothetical protein
MPFPPHALSLVSASLPTTDLIHKWKHNGKHLLFPGNGLSYASRFITGATSYMHVDGHRHATRLDEIQGVYQHKRKFGRFDLQFRW